MSDLVKYEPEQDQSREFYEALLYEQGWDLDLLINRVATTHPEWPRLLGVLIRVVLYPARTYCCSASPSQYVKPIGYRLDFGEGVIFDGVPEACTKYWEDVLAQNGGDPDAPGDYYEFHRCCVEVGGAARPYVGGVLDTISPPFTVRLKGACTTLEQANREYYELAVKQAHESPLL